MINVMMPKMSDIWRRKRCHNTEEEGNKWIVNVYMCLCV